MSRGEDACERVNEVLRRLTGGQLWVGWPADYDGDPRYDVQSHWEVPLFMTLDAERRTALGLGEVMAGDAMIESLGRAEDRRTSSIPQLEFARGNNVWPVLCVLRDFSTDPGVYPEPPASSDGLAG